MDWDKWLEEALEALDLNDEVYIEYVKGILSDETSAIEEKVEGILDFLSAATDENLDSFKLKITEWATQREEQRKKEERKAKEEKPLETFQVNLAASLPPIEEKPSRKEELSIEERRRRDALLSRYAYDDELQYDENGDILITSISHKEETTTSLEKNVNAQKVKEAEALKREQSKVAHQQKVQRDKEQREKELQKKEKEKKRTQKKEKRRL